MSRWKRFLGLDGFDTAVHIALTGILALLLATKDPATQKPSDYLVLAGASLVLYAIRRRIALGRRPSGAEVTGEVSGVHLKGDTEARLAELEGLYGRVAELEERVDFSERLLARNSETSRLDRPGA